MKLIDCIRRNHCIQHVTFPTRCRGTQNPSLLDLVFTNNDFIESVNCLSPLGKSDHAVLNILCNFGVVSDANVSKHNYSKGNYNSFCNFVRDQLDSNGFIPSSVVDVETFFNFVTDLLHDGLSKFVSTVSSNS